MPPPAVIVVVGAPRPGVAKSPPVLFPAFILESVDRRLDMDEIRAYSCAERMGGGKKGEPGDGKGDEETESLLTATESAGVVSVWVGRV